MKVFRLIIFSFIISFGCSAPSSDDREKEATTTPAVAVDFDSSAIVPEIPAGATTESYPDVPGLMSVRSTSGNGTYKNGKRQGVWVTYHPNGLVNTMTSYVDGKREGLHVEANVNGGVTKRCFYHNDLRHGEYKEFNYTTLKEERFYQYDKLEGVVKIFYDNGKVMEEGSYKNGTRDGVSKWYDQAGKLTISYEYKNGELVKK